MSESIIFSNGNSGGGLTPLGADQGTSVQALKTTWGRPFSNVAFPENITGENRAVALDWNDNTLSQFLIFAIGTRKAWQLNTVDGNVKMDVVNTDPIIAPMDLLSRFYTDADGPQIGTSVKKGENVLWIAYDMQNNTHQFAPPNNARYIMPAFGLLQHMCQINITVDTMLGDYSNILVSMAGSGANAAFSWDPPNTGATAIVVADEPGFTIQVQSTSNIIVNGVAQLMWTSGADNDSLTLVKLGNGNILATSVIGTWT